MSSARPAAYGRWQGISGGLRWHLLRWRGLSVNLVSFPGWLGEHLDSLCTQTAEHNRRSRTKFLPTKCKSLRGTRPIQIF